MKRLNHSGFTMVEIMVVLPIATLALTAILSYMFGVYTDMLETNAEANLRLEGEIMLLDLEDELLFTTGYTPSISSNLDDDYAPVGGWDASGNPGLLIINETALTAPRRDPNREFVRERIYNCNSGYAGYNPIATNNLVYFTTENTNNTYKTLYRRTLTPQYDTCLTNYKTQSCPVENVGTGICDRQDTMLSNKVVDFKVEYFDENNVPIPIPGGNLSDGEMVKLTVILGQKIYKKTLEVPVSISYKKVN